MLLPFDQICSGIEGRPIEANDRESRQVAARTIAHLERVIIIRTATHTLREKRLERLDLASGVNKRIVLVGWDLKRFPWPYLSPRVAHVPTPRFVNVVDR